MNIGEGNFRSNWWGALNYSGTIKSIKHFYISVIRLFISIIILLPFYFVEESVIHWKW